MAPLGTRGGGSGSGYLSKHFLSFFLIGDSVFTPLDSLLSSALVLARVSYLVSEYGLLKLGCSTAQ